MNPVQRSGPWPWIAAPRCHAAVRRALRPALVLAVLSGCGGSGGWVSDHPDVADRARQQPAGFVEPVRTRFDTRQALAGSYTLRVTRGVAGRTLDMAIAARRPGDLDMLVLDPTGAIQAYLRANDAEVGLYVAEDRVLYRGPAGRDAFERALGLDLSARDAVAVLLGQGLDTETLPLGRARWDPDRRRVRVDHGETASAWFHPVSMRIDRVEHRDDRGVVTAETSMWLEVEPPVPSTLRLEVEPEGYGLRLVLLGEPELAPEFPATFFDLQVPAGTLELPLSDLARDGGLFRRAGPDGVDQPPR